MNPVHLLEQLAKATSYKLHYWRFFYPEVEDKLPSIFDCLTDTVAIKQLQNCSATQDETLRRCLAALYVDSYVLFTTIDEVRSFIIHTFLERHIRRNCVDQILIIGDSFSKELEERLNFK
jgi:hypothetical protein